MTRRRMTRRVLIVEDEALVALTLEDVLTEAGYVVCGIADRPGPALEIARTLEPDIAVIDVRLAGGDDGIVLAEQLAVSTPMLILFATGNPAEVRARARAGHGCLSKPFQSEWLLAALEEIQNGGTTAIPSYFALPVGAL
ncbi:MAG: response regulator [Acetobacteraceae bacterium]|nr:response regulator [Acetobacteraceae bacterium]